MAGKRKKRKSFLNIIIVLLVFVTIIIISGYIKMNPDVKTVTIYQGESSDTVSAKGIAVFEDELITAPNKGVVIMNYSDGTRVTANTHISTVYDCDVDEGKSTRIAELNEKINYLEMNIKNKNSSNKKNESINSNIANKMKQISILSIDGDFESIERECSELESIFASGDKEDIKVQLEELKSRRDDEEKTITGNKEEYISKHAGVVFSNLDGYETTININTIKDVSVASFKNLWNGKNIDYEKEVKDGYIYGKIISNYEAQILALVDTNKISDIKEGSEVYINFSKRSMEEIPAEVKKISSTGGKTVLTLIVTHNVEDFLGERKFEFEIVKNKYSGLKVNNKAIQNEGDKSFVWVVKDDKAKKCYVEVLCKTDEYSIVKEDNSAQNPLLLYDIVVIDCKNISEGKQIYVNN